MKIVARLIVSLVAAVVAAFDTAVFYLIMTHVFHWTATWPVVAAVFWIQETVFGLSLKQELKKEGLL